MVRGIPNVTVPSINYTMARTEKMSLPVEPSSLMYSHFEHVSGVPAPKGTQGVTISKLNLLDVLIGQVNQIKKGPLSQFSQLPPVPMAENLDPKLLTTLIENYTNQIREARAASAAMPYIPAPSAPSGALFSLVA